MSVRKIKVLSTVGASGTIETNVTTLGELKPLLEAKEINTSGMKMMVGETRNELNLDDAVLPEGDFKLYLMPAKTKSGASKAQLYETLSETYAALAEIEENEEYGIEEKVSVKKSDEDPDMADLRRVAGGDWLG